jgi:hypothetical protein
VPDKPTQPSNDVFVLGAGFSKAVHEDMPLIADLNRIVQEKFGGDSLFAADRLSRFIQNGNFEVLLSYLGTDAPWKTPAETWSDRSLFHTIAETIAVEIIERETRCNTPSSQPIWLQKLAIYFDWFRNPVISFNYDTILERAAWFPKVFSGERKSFASGINAAHHYPPTMQDIRASNPKVSIGNPLGRSTFPLIKLHGSINWFYSGTDSFPGEQVYFAETHKDNPRDDYQIVQVYAQNKSRLIIPPVSEKSAFYSNFLVRSLWKGARDALTKAPKIFFIGYSLPETDLTTRQLLLSSVQPEAEIFIVSRGDPSSKEKKELIARYRKALPQVAKAKFNTRYISASCVQDLAWELLGSDPNVYNQYAMPQPDTDLTRLWEQR